MGLTISGSLAANCILNPSGKVIAFAAISPERPSLRTGSKGGKIIISF